MDSLHTFSRVRDASLQHDNPCIPQPQREHDRYLLDTIIQSAQFTTQPWNQEAELLLSLPTGRHLGWRIKTQWTGARSVFPTSISLHIAAAHAVTLSIKTAPLPTSESYGYQRIGLGATRKGLFSTPHQCMASSSTGALFSIILIQTSTLLVRSERAQTLRSISTNWSKPIPPVVFAGNANIRTVAGPRASSRCCVALKRHPGCNSPNSSCTFARHRNHWSVFRTLESREVKSLRQVTLTMDFFSLGLDLTDPRIARHQWSLRNNHATRISWLGLELAGKRMTSLQDGTSWRWHCHKVATYGLLSFLQFLIRIKEFTGMYEPWLRVLATDSQGVLNTLHIGDPQPRGTGWAGRSQ